MNMIKRLFFGGRKQKSRQYSLWFGMALFTMMLLFCMIGAYLFPLDAHKSEGQLKNMPPSMSYLRVPASLKSADIVSISSTLSYSMALREDHKLVVWGDAPSDLKRIKSKDIKQIASGYTHSLALDTDGVLFGWGSNEHGQSEIPEAYKKIKIQSIYAGEDCSAILSQDGFLYLWGNTNAFGGQIADVYQGHIKNVTFGIHHLALILDDDKIVILGNQGSELADTPKHLTDGSETISDIALSGEQAIALHENGCVSIWGQELEMPSIEEPIVRIDASSHAIFALGKSGKIYASGRNEFKELEISMDERYNAIYADTYQIYGVSDSIHAWGNPGFRAGSDRQGRDILTRLVHGGLLTMGIGFIACLLETILGTLFGILAGYCGGWVDHIIMRFADIVASIPFLPLLITLSAFLSRSLGSEARIWMIMILLGLLSWPSLARIVRSAILVEREKEYVWSAKIMGASTMRILGKELLPQVMYLILVNATLAYADAMLIESSLSFLGFGVQAPYPTWGNMLDGAQTTFVLEHCWWQWVFPALCIILVVFSVNMIGEGLRSKWDPRGGE